MPHIPCDLGVPYRGITSTYLKIFNFFYLELLYRIIGMMCSIYLYPSKHETFPNKRYFNGTQTKFITRIIPQTLTISH
jgi:hypothetical protein